VLREKLFACLDQESIELPMMHQRTLKRRNLFLAVLLLGILAAKPQTPARGAASGSDVISFLNKTLSWYHQVSTQQELVRDPADLIFLNDNRPVADQIVRLSFDFARALAKATPTQPAATAPSDIASASTQYQRLAEAAARADQRVQQIQQELDGMRKKLPSAYGKKRTTLEATIAETQGELELFQARRDALHSMMQVSNGRPGEATNLPAQVEELARTVPAAEDKEPGTTAPASSSGSSGVAPASLSRKPPSGILAVISDVMAQRRRMTTLDEHLRLTDSLAQSARELGAPLGEKMRELAQKGDQLADQPDSTDPAVLAQQKKDLDALTAQYKQVSATLLPLGRQSILLDIYKHGVSNWRNAVKAQYQAGLKGLVVRLAGLGVILGVVFAISELWRRATFRYITDTRRRYQFLALRRFVVWSLVAIVIAIAFASELGAVTTFAGFLTAGIAVALQNVILSVAGYFFLIGKHGLRVGDRVQVAGITGDVVEIGWVRLHLMEVSGGDSARPTGRVVAFSNAVVFQAGAGMFKQIPGTNFVWHEVTLALGQGSNYLQVEKRVMEAVNKVFSDYHDKMEMQRRTMERALYAVRTTALAPESRVRITSSGVEIVIRYPVDLDHAAEIDDRVTRELLETIGRDPKLRLMGTQIEAQSA
jgi:small-conductance mechanosensitive channel